MEKKEILKIKKTVTGLKNVIDAVYYRLERMKEETMHWQFHLEHRT